VKPQAIKQLRKVLKSIPGIKEVRVRALILRAEDHALTGVDLVLDDDTIIEFSSACTDTPELTVAVTMPWKR